MSGVRQEITSSGHKVFGEVADRLRPERLPRVLKVFGERLITSVQMNFEAGGRPTEWEPSRRAAEQGGQTLKDKGRLSGSVSSEVAGDTVSVGTNVVYGAIHQFGFDGPVQVPAHKRQITQVFGRAIEPRTIDVGPHERRMSLTARPWLLVQDADHDYFGAVLARHVQGEAV